MKNLTRSLRRASRAAAMMVAPVLAGATVVLAVPAPATAGRSGRLSVPVIHERFTLLPCAGAPAHRSTLEQEGCLEHQIIARDRRIDALNRAIFTRFGDDAARRRFIAGHDAWLTYRRAYCLSRSDASEGGSLGGLIDTRCTAEQNTGHIGSLRDFLHDLDRN